MKYLHIIFIIVLATVLMLNSAIAQKTVSILPGYTHQTFYSLENGVVKQEPNDNWDIAFQIDGFAASLRINSANGVALHKVPNADQSGWASIDTAGIATWAQRYNSDQTWDGGAFNIGADTSNAFDLGWGVYDPITHHVNGDSVFIITLSNGDVKKFRMDRLSGGVYAFTYANIDGTSEASKTVDKADFQGKNFGYFSFATESSLDREPASADWDLLFTRYISPVAPGFYYGVTGVLSNIGVKVSEMRGVDPASVTIDDTVSAPFSYNLSTIGHDWKSYDNMARVWSFEDMLTYFVKNDSSDDFYQLTFTGFGGGATGDFIFDQNGSTTAIDPVLANIELFQIGPNPASSLATVEIEQKEQRSFSLSILDMQGRTIRTQSHAAGTQRVAINLEGLSSGLYLVQFSNAQGAIAKRLMVK